jgi:pyridoxine 5-phosphate synthase
MTKLSVNVNKIATLRNSRGKNNPDVIQVSLDIIKFGAHGITVHPRPDERHIRKTDVYALKKAIAVELNVEGYPSPDFMKMIEEVRPAQCTLVPDPPEALTSNAGWKISENQKQLQNVLGDLKNWGVRSSVFVDPGTPKSELLILKNFGCDRIELYTEDFANAFGTKEQATVTSKYKVTAEDARSVGLAINAGHDLSLKNLKYLITEIPFIDEVSIGHALISDALYFGLSKVVELYLKELGYQIG